MLIADFVQYDLPKNVHEPKARMMEVFDAHVNRNADVLRDYLKDEEAATIMFTLLDEQRARKFWEEELLQEGRAEGRAEGMVRGESRLGALITQLQKLGRTDDAFRAASNEAYRQQLYRELNIQ